MHFSPYCNPPPHADPHSYCALLMSHAVLTLPRSSDVSTTFPFPVEKTQVPLIEKVRSSCCYVPVGEPPFAYDSLFLRERTLPSFYSFDSFFISVDVIRRRRTPPEAVIIAIFFFP